MKVKKLKYPLVIDIIFYILTVIIPISVVLIQGLTDGNLIYKSSFSFVCVLLVTWLFAKKFMIKPFIEKIKTEKINLEHDYKLDIGNTEKCEYLWLYNELIMIGLNTIEIILISMVLVLLTIGVQKGNILINGTVFIVIICYIIALAMKIIYLSVKLNHNHYEE